MYPKAEFEIETDKNYVKLGHREWSSWEDLRRKSLTTFSWDVLKEDFGYYPKGVAQSLYPKYGPKIHHRLPSAMYNTFIRGNFSYDAYFSIKRWGNSWRLFNPVLVNKAIAVSEIVQQAVDDNLPQLIPAIIFHQKDPSEIRAMYGKALWRKVANSSKTRSNLIYNTVEQEAQLEVLISLKTGVIDSLRKQHPRTSTEAVITSNRVTPRVKDFRHTLNLISDTERMARQLGEEVNHSWGYNRWVREHERMVQPINRAKYSDEPFCSSLCWEEQGYTFTRLISPLEVRTEGDMMSHCVGSYSSYCQMGKYSVFKVEGEGERATLGCSIDQEGLLSFSQMYGRFNSQVSPQMRTAANSFIRKLNLQTQEEKQCMYLT